MSDDVRALRAAAHPVRLQILSLLTSTAMSAAEVARELGITHANASYHLRVLLDADELVEAGEERIRGGIAKRYRHPWQERSRSHARGGRELQVRAMVQELQRRFAAVDPQARMTLSDAELWVEPEVWERALLLMVEGAELIHAQARPPGTEGTQRVAVTMAAFGMKEADG